MVQARHITWKYKLNENETISFTNRVQIYAINLQNFTIDSLKFEIKGSYIYSNYHQFWSFSTGRTGLRKTERLHTQPTSVQLDSTLT